MEESANLKNLKIIVVLQKRLQGEVLSDHEVHMLDMWLQQSEANRLIYDEMSEPEQLASSLVFFNQTDSEAQLNTLHQRIRRETFRKRAVYLAAAAMLLLCLGLVFWLLPYKSTDGVAESQMVQQQDIAPGYNRATLKFSDGQEMNLDSSKSGLVSKGYALRYEDGELIEATAKSVNATLITPHGGQYQVTLDDGTRVWLNAASELKYPMVFRGVNREVYLKGEAFFEVSKNPAKPFIVHTEKQSIQVVGTAFAVRAYDANEQTTLVEGRLKVASGNKQKTYDVYPGYQVSVKAGNVSLQEVSIDDYVSWKDGYFVGTSVSLADLIPDLERWYNVKFIDFASSISDEIGFVRIYRNEPLSAVLNALALTFEVKFEVSGKEVRVKRIK
ncbi:FecR family protein [Sphingobacterium faecale]|uniref:FecR domain-containing protein n=1 Tax=Sphingobacterium faecale TaxID=2803775 RepID=A0ABS1R922_9SPHI|nr:FecR domain-containing protein [Sphingobacterium faecale]MBL1411212.1 FecR domain-containing protein [Sphingobacterium faecale]